MTSRWLGPFCLASGACMLFVLWPFGVALIAMGVVLGRSAKNEAEMISYEEAGERAPVGVFVKYLMWTVAVIFMFLVVFAAAGFSILTMTQ